MRSSGDGRVWFSISWEPRAEHERWVWRACGVPSPWGMRFCFQSGLRCSFMGSVCCLLLHNTLAYSLNIDGSQLMYASNRCGPPGGAWSLLFLSAEGQSNLT